MLSMLEQFGIDEEDFAWQDLSVCDQTMPINMFFDDYEADEQVAKITDQACLSCPVMVQCLTAGMEGGEWGCWGAIFLVNGKPDENKNSHKTAEVWNEIKERLGGSIRVR